MKALIEMSSLHLNNTNPGPTMRNCAGSSVLQSRSTLARLRTSRRVGFVAVMLTALVTAERVIVGRLHASRVTGDVPPALIAAEQVFLPDAYRHAVRF
jgi:hypothetical protein